MGFVWVHADSFLRCVASPLHSFVTTVYACMRSSDLRIHDRARKRLDGTHLDLDDLKRDLVSHDISIE